MADAIPEVAAVIFLLKGNKQEDQKPMCQRWPNGQIKRTGVHVGFISQLEQWDLLPLDLFEKILFVSATVRYSVTYTAKSIPKKYNILVVSSQS